MDFELSSEQAMLKDSLTRLLADHYGFETRRRLVHETNGWSPAIWSRLAELGVLAAPFPESDGGLGGGAVETLVIGEALGAVLSAEPYLSTIVLAGTALRLTDAAHLRRAILPRLMAGETVVACVIGDKQVRAERLGDGWRLSGELVALPHAGGADQLLVQASSEAGELLVLVGTGEPGVQVRSLRTFDGLNAGDVTFNSASAPDAAVLALGDAARQMSERLVEHATAYLAAEAVGLMAMLLELTLEHLRTRRQFGQPLGKFQALQHRAADMLVHLEQARSMALYAAMMTEASGADERRRAFAAIRAVVATSASFVGASAVQLHGGIGVTDEHRAGWGFRRLTMIELALGDPEANAERLAELGGLVAAPRPSRWGTGGDCDREG